MEIPKIYRGKLFTNRLVKFKSKYDIIRTHDEDLTITQRKQKKQYVYDCFIPSGRVIFDTGCGCTQYVSYTQYGSVTKLVGNKIFGGLFYMLNIIPLPFVDPYYTKYILIDNVIYDSKLKNDYFKLCIIFGLTDEVKKMIKDSQKDAKFQKLKQM